MKKNCFTIIGIICLTVVMTVLCALPVMASDDTAKEPGVFWAMDTNQFDWVGENASLDTLEYSDYYEAAGARLYSAAWAGRYGGVAIVAKELNITVSSEKNRFMVVNVMPDFLAIENQFDKFTAIYWKKDDAKAYHYEDARNAFSSLHGATEDEFYKVIIDLNWAEEMTLETLRLEIFSSSLEATASGAEGYNCGNLYFEYIALFDTLEAATDYVYKTPVEKPTQAPTNEPGNTNEPEATPKATESTGETDATLAPSETAKPTTAPGGDDAENKKSPMIGIIIGVVVVVLIAVLAIVLIIKPKKK